VLCVLWAALLDAQGLTSEGLFRIAPAGSEKEALLKASTHTSQPEHPPSAHPPRALTRRAVPPKALDGGCVKPGFSAEAIAAAVKVFRYTSHRSERSCGASLHRAANVVTGLLPQAQGGHVT
jgi:hypothetical protein